MGLLFNKKPKTTTDYLKEMVGLQKKQSAAEISAAKSQAEVAKAERDAIYEEELRKNELHRMRLIQEKKQE